MHDQPLSADDTVIVFVDLQEGIINVGATNEPRRLRAAVAALGELAATFGLPIVVSCVPTTGGIVAPVLSEVTARHPTVEALVRGTADALEDAPFRAALEAQGRKTLIIAGVATEVAVRLCAVNAHRCGYHVIVAVDACSGFDARTESASLTYLTAAGVELSAVTTIAAQLGGDFQTERGRAAMHALQSTLTSRAHHHSADDDAGR